MEEPEVIAKTINYLSDQGWKMWINDHPSLKSLDSDHYPRHYLTIGRFIPDIVGYDDNGIPFAIEAKGEKDIRKGIGQALYYSLGASKVFVASSSNILHHLNVLAEKYNFGLIEVGEDVSVKSQDRSFETPYRLDFEQSLKLLDLGLNESHNQLTSLKLNQLLNYFGPALSIKQENMSKGELFELYDNEGVMIGSKGEILRGAQVFGFILGNSARYQITPEGELAVQILKSYGITSLQDLEQVKKELGGNKHEPFYKSYPAIATYLRMIFLKLPYIQDFFDFILLSKISFKQVLKRILEVRPNIALNFLCVKNKRYDCLDFLQDVSLSLDRKTSKFVTEYLQQSIIDSFKKHLQAIGLLTEGSAHAAGIETYNPESDYWQRNTL